MKNWLMLIGGLLALVITIFTLAGKASHRHMQSIMCGDSMLSISSAVRLWAADHDGHLPANLQAAAEQLRSPQILICPGDSGRQPAASWSALTPDHSSYEIVGEGLSVTNGKSVYLRCKTHDFVMYANGSVFDGGRKISR